MEKSKKKLDFMKAMCRRSHFTLVELLIVLIIVLFALSAIGVNVFQAIKQERFNTGVSLVVDRLQLAQDLMLVLKGDVRVRFRQEETNKGLNCCIEVDKSLHRAFSQLLNKYPEIKGIVSATFEDQEAERIHEGVFALDFISGGSKMSRGKLTLYGDDKKTLKKTVILSGNPQPIGRLKEFVELNENDDKSHDLLFPKEIKKFLEEHQKENVSSS